MDPRQGIGARVVAGAGGPRAARGQPTEGAGPRSPRPVGCAAARARKDFKESDRIRDDLAAMGVVLKDGKDADGKPVTTWETAR